MKAFEFLPTLIEARGVSARQPGDVYVNVNDPNDKLTIIEIKFVRPESEYKFDSRSELEGALDQVIPADGKRIHDNNPTEATKAAIVAHVENAQGEQQYHVRYMQDLMSIHNKWKSFNGYKYQKAIETESLPIKPSDMIPDETPRTVQELVSTIHSNLERQLGNTEYAHMAGLIEQVLENAAGANAPIQFEDRRQASIIAKYAGEYAGVIAMLSDNLQNISKAEIEERYNTQNLSASTVVFPQDTTAMLVDSYVITPEETRIGVSSKMFKAGGAASSLLGIYKMMSNEIARQYPKGATIVKDLAALPAFSGDPTKADKMGPIVLARQMGIISQQDIEEIQRLDRTAQDPDVLQSLRLQKIISNQGVGSETLQRPEYSVYLHLIAAIVNLVIARVNNEPEFVEVINAVLRETGYIQILTKVGLQGNNVTFTYYAKLPDNNKPFVYNKNYFATGNKGRVGFKLEK